MTLRVQAPRRCDSFRRQDVTRSFGSGPLCVLRCAGVLGALCLSCPCPCIFLQTVKKTTFIATFHAVIACHSMQDKDSLARIILENGVNHVVHLATLLSGAPVLVVINRYLWPVPGGSSIATRSCVPAWHTFLVSHAAMMRPHTDTCMA